MECVSIKLAYRAKRAKFHFTKITVFENRRKVAFNIASEASYVYILSGQKFNKNVKMIHFESLKLAVEQCYQAGNFFNTTKMGGKSIQKIQMQHFDKALLLDNFFSGNQSLSTTQKWKTQTF